MDYKDLVKKYVALRDKKAAMKAEYDASVVKIDTALDKVDALLLAFFNDTGIDSLKTEAGTAYKYTRTSATVADWESTLPFIQANELWALLEKRVNKTAVEEYITAYNEVPPGVNVTRTAVVGIRRS